MHKVSTASGPATTPLPTSPANAGWNAILPLESIADQAASLIYVLDIENCVPVYSNDAVSAFFGKSPTDLRNGGRDFLSEIVHPDDRDFARDHFHAFRTLRDGEVIEFEQRIRNAEGEWRWVAIRESVFQRHEDGTPSQILGTSIDITEQKRTVAQLQASERLLRSAFENAPIGKALLETDGRWLQVNPALCEIVGYPADELLSLDFQTITHPDDLEKDLELVDKLLSGEISQYAMEKRYIRKNGSIVWTLLNVSLARDASGNPFQFISQIQDITKRKETEARLERQAQKLEEAQRVAGIGSWEYDVATGQIEWSREMFRLMGFEPDAGEPALSDLRERYHPDDLAEIESRRTKAITDGEAYDLDVRVLNTDGSIRWLHILGHGEIDGGKVVRLYGTALDITERMIAQQTISDYSIALETKMAELEALAMRDGLTGLLNHRAFHERLSEAYSYARRYGEPLSVIMLDVDHFKQFNDTFGHPEGDTVLRGISDLIVTNNRTSDVIARYGGEEFALVLPNTSLVAGIVVAERIRSAIETHPWPLRTVTASLGITALTPADTERTLVVRADAALYTSKQEGRNRVTVA